MAFSELELKAIDKTVGDLCRRRSPRQYAGQLRFVYDVEGHRVSIYEERPPRRGTGEWTRQGVARFRYARTTGQWTLFWMRTDLKWHVYDPDVMPRDLASLVELVERDKHCAFFG